MRFPFSDHIAQLEQLLAGREAIVDAVERQLFSARGKANAQNGDRESIAEVFDLFGLSGQLQAAHLADGFEPTRQDNYSRGVDPVELVLRACHYWESSRWPGRNVRLVFTHSLFTVYILRHLEQLSLRIWDEGDDRAAERLQHVQRLLDVLNTGGTSPHGTRFVRNARWLIHTAQGPLTRHVSPYFIKAARISASIAETDRLEIHKAGAVLAGGHLRSQLRHLSWRTGWAFDDPQLLALTRSSNSMDMALLVGDLVPLLDAYAAACVRREHDVRLALADAILQGLSADPELLLTRLDLLGPSTMIDDLFIDRSGAGASPYTSMGELHRERLARYSELIANTAEPLQQDSRVFDPADAAYSPLGVVYGFCADLFSNMVLNTLRPPSSLDLSLEDVFLSQGQLEEKRAQAREWERLPKRKGEPAPFEHSTEWAAHMYARLARALEARASHPAEPNASSFPTARLYVVARGVTIDSPSDGLAAEAQSAKAGALPAGIVSAQEHCLMSDVTRARLTGATFLPADRLVADRAEGRLLASVHSEGSWFGVSKVPLTLFMCQGKDALITDVPREVIDILRLACPEILVVIDK